MVDIGTALSLSRHSAVSRDRQTGCCRLAYGGTRHLRPYFGSCRFSGHGWGSGLCAKAVSGGGQVTLAVPASIVQRFSR